MLALSGPVLGQAVREVVVRLTSFLVAGKLKHTGVGPETCEHASLSFTTGAGAGAGAVCVLIQPAWTLSHLPTCLTD